MVSRYEKPFRPDGFMNYSRALRSDELMHFGILGMKWGVRRYQNPDGTLTEAGKRRYYNSDGSWNMSTRDGRKYHRTKRNSMMNEEIDYDGEFEKTDAGKKLKKAHDDAYSKYFDSEGYDPKLEKAFSKKEYDYLSKEGEYVAKKMIDKYGDLGRTYLLDGKKVTVSDKELIKKYGKQHVYIHGVV